MYFQQDRQNGRCTLHLILPDAGGQAIDPCRSRESIPLPEGPSIDSRFNGCGAIVKNYTLFT